MVELEAKKSIKYYSHLATESQPFFFQIESRFFNYNHNASIMRI
jgi:hypothetical protein